MIKRNILLAAMPSFLLVIVSFVILYFGWTFHNQANQAILDLNAKIDGLEISEELLSDGVVTTRELLEIQSRVEASEQRALDYLGFYEALGFALTVGGLIVATIGAVAATFGLRNYNEIVTELDKTQKRYKDTQNQIEENERASKRTLETLNSSRDVIKSELEASLRADWEKSHLALSLLPLAERQYQSGNVDGALDTYNRANDLDPVNPVPHYYVGYILTQKNKLKEAESSLREALKLDEKFLHAQAALGYTLRRIGDPEKNATIRRKIYSEAEKLLKMALAANEQLVDADGESWNGSLAGLYKRSGDVEQAKHYYERAAVVTPLSSYPAVNLAMIALEHNPDEINDRFERVERLARLKILAVQENYWSYGDLLMAQLALGKNEDALDNLETLIELVPIGVKDVLPRVKTAIELLHNTSAYSGDKRNLETIAQVIARLTAEIEQ